MCACVVAALAELAPDPATEPGQFFHCRGHQQMVIWDGYRWRWSNQADDIAQLPRTAECPRRPAVPQ